MLLGGTGQLSSGTILQERYEIVSTLGRGGMGAVYLAIDQRLNNSRIAIKEMSVKTESQEDLEAAILAFKQEANLLITLRHEALLRIIDFFSIGDRRWYLVMDYIQGETLKSILEQKGPLPESEVKFWAIQLCNILDYLHNQEPPIIFRDLKPANIMLTSSGAIKLIDFGIARHFKADSTTDTTAYGSAGFAPPEQYGQNQTDARSDIYALGATLHYLLTGLDPDKKPFAFETPGNLVSVSKTFEQAIMASLELRAENRPNSVKELLALFQGDHSQNSKTGDETTHLEVEDNGDSGVTTILKQDKPKQDTSVNQQKRLYIALGVVASLIFILALLGLGVSGTFSKDSAEETKKTQTSETTTEESFIPKSERKATSTQENKSTGLTEKVSYSYYTDDNFAFETKYPSHFETGGAPSQGTGRSFVSPNGEALMEVWAEYNNLNYSVDSLYQEKRNEIEGRGGVVGYAPKSEKWLVITYAEANGTSTYLKIFVNPDTLTGFSFNFPTVKEKSTYGPMIEVIEDSFTYSTNKKPKQKETSQQTIDQWDDYVLTGLKLDMWSDQVINIVGEPSSMQDEIWYYNDFDVNMSGDILSWVTLKTNKIATTRGLRIGDSEAKLYELYGPLDQIEDVLYYQEVENIDAPLLGFVVENGKVTVISLMVSGYLNY